MNTLDIITVLIPSITMGFGIWKGLVKQVFSILGLIFGFFLALRYYKKFALLFGSMQPEAAAAAGYVLIILLSIIAGFLLGFIFSKFFKAAGVGWLNRLLGGLVGFLKGGVFVVLVVMTLIAILPAENEILKSSVTLPYIVGIARKLVEWTPQAIKRDLAEKVSKTRSAWSQKEP